jgi:hypothetical protein
VPPQYRQPRVADLGPQFESSRTAYSNMESARRLYLPGHSLQGRFISPLPPRAHNTPTPSPPSSRWTSLWPPGTPAQPVMFASVRPSNWHIPADRIPRAQRTLTFSSAARSQHISTGQEPPDMSRMMFRGSSHNQWRQSFPGPSSRRYPGLPGEITPRSALLSNLPGAALPCRAPLVSPRKLHPS